MSAWSSPYLGHQHLVDPNDRDRWATIADRGSFATLICHGRGSGFRATTTTHSDVDEAKSKGEAFVGGAA